MKKLLAPLTLFLLLFSATSALAIRRFTLYLPDRSACAIYHDRIYSEQSFNLWLETDRKLTIKANKDLKVAVVLEGKLVIPYQIDAVSETELAEHSYHISMTGNHVVLVRGRNPEATVSFCLD